MQIAVRAESCEDDSPSFEIRAIGSIRRVHATIFTLHQLIYLGHAGNLPQRAGTNISFHGTLRAEKGTRGATLSVPPAVAGGYCAANTHPLPQVVLTNVSR